MKTFWPILLVALIGCGKQSPFASEDPPPVYMGGRVVLINSDTPVPNTLVRFTKWANTCLTCPMSYIEVGTDTTDENGRFEIPSGTGATMAIAYGPTDVFDHESQEGNMEAYWAEGGEMKLQLVPPAWVRVIAIDIEPFNPEIDYLAGDTEIGSSEGFITLNSMPRIWRVDGNIDQYLTYQYVFTSGITSSVNYYDVFPIAFDTTDCIIHY